MKRWMGFSQSQLSSGNLLPLSQCLGAKGADSLHVALGKDTRASHLALLDNRSSTHCQPMTALLTAVAVV